MSNAFGVKLHFVIDLNSFWDHTAQASIRSITRPNKGRDYAQSRR